MVQRRLFLVIAFLAAIVFSEGIEAQPKWKVYTAPDKSFSVELPWKPIYSRRNFIGFVSGTPTMFGSRAGDIYDLSMYTNESFTHFFIIVYDVPLRRNEQEFDAEADSIMEKVNGSNKRFIKHEAVTFNGLHGQQYVYERGKLSGVAVLINAGHRVYFIHFYTENSKGIARGPVNRVFTTFEPTP